MWSRKEEAVLLIIHPYTQKWLRNRGLRQSTPTNKWFTQGKRAVRPTGPAYTSFKLFVQRHYIGMFPISNKIQENRKPHTQSEVTNLNQPPLSVSIVTSCSKCLAEILDLDYMNCLCNHFTCRQLSALMKSLYHRRDVCFTACISRTDGIHGTTTNTARDWILTLNF